MRANARRTRFEKRVELEREFLTHINLRFAKIAPLAGMTNDAIASWQTRALKAGGGEVVNDVYRLLIEVSTRAELIADHSRDVFDADGRNREASIEDLRTLLMKTLTSVHL